MNKPRKSGLHKGKSIAAVFAGVSFITGFFFLDRGSEITGNVIVNGNVPPFSIISLIGLFLVFCSAALVVYIVKK
ncbi:MAG: hypothetical protein WDZ69_03140 [Candidatus Pacearchaeota archaeon]